MRPLAEQTILVTGSTDGHGRRVAEELVKAGVMLAGEGLHPSSKGARVRFSGTKRTGIDGPFTEKYFPRNSM